MEDQDKKTMSLNTLDKDNGLQDPGPNDVKKGGVPYNRSKEERKNVLVEKLPTLRDFLLPEIEPIPTHKFIILSLFASAP